MDRMDPCEGFDVGSIPTGSTEGFKRAIAFAIALLNFKFYFSAFTLFKKSVILDLYLAPAFFFINFVFTALSMAV